MPKKWVDLSACLGDTDSQTDIAYILSSTQRPYFLLRVKVLLCLVIYDS
jgi:hypothetical protein